MAENQLTMRFSDVIFLFFFHLGKNWVNNFTSETDVSLGWKTVRLNSGESLDFMLYN